MRSNAAIGLYSEWCDMDARATDEIVVEALNRGMVYVDSLEHHSSVLDEITPLRKPLHWWQEGRIERDPFFYLTDAIWREDG